MRGDILLGADEQFCAVRGDKSIFCFSRLQIKTVRRHWTIFVGQTFVIRMRFEVCK